MVERGLGDSEPVGLEHNRATSAFERRVARALGDVASDAAPLLVACSGGPDSSAALVAVARVREAQHAGELVAATFNHGLRPPPETEADRAAVEALAELLGVRCIAGTAEPPLGGSEAAARSARYSWLGVLARELDAGACVTGHTLDDQAETVLLRLTRGTGLAGAAGMASDAPWPIALEPAGPDPEPAPRLLRPLLELRRGEIKGYLEALGLAAAGLDPRLDPSNETLAFDRNRVRRRVLPELRRLNPRAAEALAGFAARARRDDAALETWAEAASERVARVDGASARIERLGLRTLPEAVAVRVLRRTAGQLGLTLDARQLEALLQLAARRGARLTLAGGRAWTEDADLHLQRDQTAGG